jgi:hypothetical protein
MAAKHLQFCCFWSAHDTFRLFLLVTADFSVSGGLMIVWKIVISSSMDISSSEYMCNSLSIAMSLIHAHLDGPAVANHRMRNTQYTLNSILFLKFTYSAI